MSERRRTDHSAANIHR